MPKVGIICDWGFSRHPQFRSYFYAVQSLLGTPKFINLVDELNDIETLIIGDELYHPHKSVWQQDGFIQRCNDRNIRVVVLSDERIFNSAFPWNEGNYRVLRLFKNLHHFAIDVDDCKLLGVPLNRVAPSRQYATMHNPPCKKKNELLFIGNVGGAFNSYYKRNAVIEEIGRIDGIDFVNIPPIVPTWEELIRLFAEYRFVLSPIGNGNLFTSRFYEILLAGSIPVHQVFEDTLDYYTTEATFDDCIFFKNPQEIVQKMKDCPFENSHNKYFMEDNLTGIFKQIGLL